MRSGRADWLTAVPISRLSISTQKNNEDDFDQQQRTEAAAVQSILQKNSIPQKNVFLAKVFLLRDNNCGSKSCAICEPSRPRDQGGILARAIHRC